MSVDDSKALVLRYIEAVWNRGEASALEELTTPAFRYQLGGQPERDRAGMRAFLATTRRAFPDWHVRPVQVIGEEDALAVRWEGEATHRGEFFGIAPTGRRIGVRGINCYRLEHGRIAAEWEQMDTLGMLQQLGIGPA